MSKYWTDKQIVKEYNCQFVDEYDMSIHNSVTRRRAERKGKNKWIVKDEHGKIVMPTRRKNKNL